MKELLIGLTIGAVAGGAAVYFSMKEKMRKTLDEQIAYIQRVTEERYQKEEKEQMTKYESILDEEGYSFGEPVPREDVEEEVQEPYILDEPDMQSLYESSSPIRYLSCFLDGVVLDEDREPIPYPESMLGLEYYERLKKNDGEEIVIMNPALNTFFVVDMIYEPYNDTIDSFEDDEELEEESYWEEDD